MTPVITLYRTENGWVLRGPDPEYTNMPKTWVTPDPYPVVFRFDLGGLKREGWRLIVEPEP